MVECKRLIKLLTIILLPLTWTIPANSVPTGRNQRQTTSTDSTVVSNRRTASDINVRMSNSEALQLLLAAYLSDHTHLANVTSESSIRTPITIQPALLDYENETEVEDLEKVVVNSTDLASEVELPSDVYEVSLEAWINEENAPPTPRRNMNSIDETQRIIIQALRSGSDSPSDHTIRHRGRRVATRNNDRTNRRVSEDAVVSLPIENAEVNRNILNLLQRQQPENSESSGPLDILRQRERFNMTVDYQAPFQNISVSKLMEIVILMRSDCSQMSRQKKLVQWVSGLRGILFECRNGAWVVTYLSRRKGKPRPSSITGRFKFI